MLVIARGAVTLANTLGSLTPDRHAADCAVSEQSRHPLRRKRRRRGHLGVHAASVGVLPAEPAAGQRKRDWGTTRRSPGSEAMYSAIALSSARVKGFTWAAMMALPRPIWGLPCTP